MTHLTRRQFDVLRLIAEGHTEKAISRELGITRNSVHTHCSRMLKSMGATCRAHAVALAYEQGIIGLAALIHERRQHAEEKDHELETAKALADTLGRKVVDLHRQLNSARVWAVEWQQERDALSSLLRGMARRVGEWRETADVISLGIYGEREAS